MCPDFEVRKVLLGNQKEKKGIVPTYYKRARCNQRNIRKPLQGPAMERDLRERKYSIEVGTAYRYGGKGSK